MFDVWNSLSGEYFRYCESFCSPQIREPVIDDREEIMLDLLDDVACLQSFREDRVDLSGTYWKVLREWLDIILVNYGLIGLWERWIGLDDWRVWGARQGKVTWGFGFGLGRFERIWDLNIEVK